VVLSLEVKAMIETGSTMYDVYRMRSTWVPLYAERAIALNRIDALTNPACARATAELSLAATPGDDEGNGAVSASTSCVTEFRAMA
jgi:hypothetical protein